jgi:iron complex transport system permease protein
MLMKTKAQKTAGLLVLIAAVIVLIIFAVGFGAVRIPWQNVVSVILGKLTNHPALDQQTRFIVLNLRIPRILMAVLVGMLLSLVGTSYQAVFKNPMADPYLLGTSSGAALGATLALLIPQLQVFGYFGVAVFAFIGAITTTAVVYFLAKSGNNISTVSLLLSGIIMSSFLSAVISLLMIFNHEEIAMVYSWTLGSFNGAGWEGLKIAAPVLGAGILVMSFWSKELNALLLGDAQAYSLGIDAQKVKRRILVVSSILAAVAVSMSGIIGFVGLIVPHFFRMIVGPDHRFLLLYATFGGGGFLLLCDTIARSLLSNAEIPVGIVTAILGAPFFMLLLHRNKAGRSTS